MALIAISVDPRPTVFGNKAVVTGSLTSTGVTSGHIDLSGILASVDTFVINGSGSTARDAPGSGIDGTLVYLESTVSGAAYKFTAIGNRS